MVTAGMGSRQAVRCSGFEADPVAGAGRAFVVFVAVDESLLDQGAEHASSDMVVLKGGDLVQPAAAGLVHAFLDGAEQGLLFFGQLEGGHLLKR